ncbi:hypothetical protein Glove_476g74 [Diversispora epigaea]|uniref:Uncharacterized protein n=1 Tax=Diversispora epigaea TaxID=1348612 RepID=A0A397GKQ8_9GLOM|nr:hypothetical protein Glove_476g74 [Diversispora epigaea]
MDENDTLFEYFLENNSDFENLEEIEFTEAYLEQLINSEESILLNAETDNSTLIQQILDIQVNEQESNIFHPGSFIQAHKIIQNQEKNEYSSSSDDEIENKNINIEPNLENKMHIIDETLSNIPLSTLGTWQIDANIATDFFNNKVSLGVCMSHFNYDQKNHINQTKQLRKTEKSIVHRRRCLFCGLNFCFFSRGKNCRQHSWNIFNKNIQVACNGQFSCNALAACLDIAKLADEDFLDPRYICCKCFEINGGHIHQKSGSGKPKFNCKTTGLHDEDNNKILITIANWLLHVVENNDNDKKEIVIKHILNSTLDCLQEFLLKKNKNENTNENTNKNNKKLPSLFIFQILLKINKIPNTYSIDSIQPDISNEKWSEIGKILANKIWKSRKEINQNKIEIQNPTSLENYYSAFPIFLTNFFESLIKEIFEKKLYLSNIKLKSRKNPLKLLNNQKILKIVTFMVSILVGITFPKLRVWFTQILASLSRKTKLNQQFRRLLSTLQISGHTDGQERRLEKVRMKSVDPCLRLKKEENIWNLAIIDNIDFKETTFRYGNIFDTVRNSSHATLRMIFQHQIPFNINEFRNEENEISSPLELFGMNKKIRDTLDIFDNVLDELLNVKIISQEAINYNTNFDMNTVHEKILNYIEYGCEINPPNVVILEPGGNPSSDEGIFESIQMYKNDLKLKDDEYIDVVADEAIFRRLIKLMDKWPQLRPILGQWHTSKDMCSALIVLFSSYGIFDLASLLGVKFLEKLESVVDYRSTVRVLELIWTAWAGIFKAHRIGIRVGNYNLQKSALAAFSGLFASAGKSRYASSVCHFFNILTKFPQLENKLRCVASIKINDDEKRKGHYFAYDEALETFGVKFIKQNITGDVINIENLKNQIKSVQNERDRIGILLSEYLDDPTVSTGNRAINQRYDAMWNLVKTLLQEFECTNETFLNNDMWKNIYREQLTVEGVIRLKNCFPDGIIRMRAIYYEDVLKTRPIQTGRSKLGVRKLKILTFQKELKEAKKKTTQNSELQLQSQLNLETPSTQILPIRNEEQNIHIINEANNIELPITRKRKRVANSEEEKLLEPLILSYNEPTNEEFKEILNTLSEEWDLSRVKQYVKYRRKKILENI